MDNNQSFVHTTYNNFENQLTKHILNKYCNYLIHKMLEMPDTIINEDECIKYFQEFKIKNANLFYSNKLK
jgi:hypothetical protein